MVFNKILIALAVFISVTIALLTYATASPSDNCVGAGNVAMHVAKLRDDGMPIRETVGLLVQAGVSSQTAVGLTAWIYSNPETSGTDIGFQVYQTCMTQSGEAL